MKASLTIYFPAEFERLARLATRGFPLRGRRRQARENADQPGEYHRYEEDCDSQRCGSFHYHVSFVYAGHPNGAPGVPSGPSAGSLR